MARNDGMDALVGLGILGALLGNDALNTTDVFDHIKKMGGSGRSPVPAQQNKVSPADAAKAVKEIYDSYVAVGFNEVQAFELLKLVLATKR